MVLREKERMNGARSSFLFSFPVDVILSCCLPCPFIATRMHAFHGLPFLSCEASVYVYVYVYADALPNSVLLPRYLFLTLHSGMLFSFSSPPPVSLRSFFFCAVLAYIAFELLKKRVSEVIVT